MLFPTFLGMLFLTRLEFVLCKKCRFSRNASVVAMGVVKNLRKAGDRIKERVDDILYPYRRRPK